MKQLSCKSGRLFPTRQAMDNLRDQVDNCTIHLNPISRREDFERYDCLGILYEYLLTSGTHYDSSRAFYIQDRVKTLFYEWLEDHEFVENPADIWYDGFQETLLRLATNPMIPGVASGFLTDYCSKKTRHDLLAVEADRVLCGCYWPHDKKSLTMYARGTEECLSGQPGCRFCTHDQTDCHPIHTCDPLCRREPSSKQINQKTGAIISCPSIETRIPKYGPPMRLTSRCTSPINSFGWDRQPVNEKNSKPNTRTSLWMSSADICRGQIPSRCTFFTESVVRSW